jgi:RimJ/RimL family protein N-acetyltransferase
MYIPQLQTDRLILREFREEDLDAYADMCGDPQVMKFLGGKPLSRADSWRNMSTIVGHWLLKGYGMWAVQRKENSEMIGRIGCWQPEGWPGFEVGWTLRKAYWGYGYATEAAKAAIDYGFYQLKEVQIISLIRPDNLASRRVAERLGESVIGTTTLFESQHTLIYGIDRQNWQEKSP